MIGIDLIEVERLRVAMLRTGRFKTRVFTAEEISYCDAKANPYQSFAARFAAREAFRKLHPSLSSGIKYHEVEVAVGPEGSPFFKLHGEALVLVQKLNICHIDLSLSHAGDYAMAAAVAMFECKGGKE